jgi:mono/diheme cytochrome c family protein
MNRTLLPHHLATAAVLVLFSTGCTTPRAATMKASGNPAAFAAARPVLESNCVHCHGTERLARMPALTDTAALARLKGTWIIPGQPDSSRLFQVVTLTDAQPGAMPPTGHALGKADVAKLRAWIQAGAPLPEGTPVRLVPRGERPHSW